MVALPQACLSSSQPPSAIPPHSQQAPPPLRAGGREGGRRSGTQNGGAGHRQGVAGAAAAAVPPLRAAHAPGTGRLLRVKKINKTQPPPAPRLGGREQKGLGKVVFDRQGWVAVLVAVGEVV